MRDKKIYSKYQKFLLDELMYIDSMFDIYIYLKNQHVNRVEILNIAPAFFGLTENALLESTAIRLSRLFDHYKKPITINKFINFIKSNRKEIFKEDIKITEDELLKLIEEDKIKLESFQPKIKGLKKIRDKTLAHNDRCNLEDDFDIWTNANIVIGDIHDLIQYGVDVINNYSQYTDNTFHSIQATNKLDIKTVLEILEENNINE